MSTRANAATSGDQAPAAQTTVSVSIGPRVVSTAEMRPPDTAMPVTEHP
jgi:hypothetical protein